jgi:pimeloyl-ACP methyl ester carboxylesterase
MRRFRWILLGLTLILVIVYLWPVPHPSFAQVYVDVPADKVARLQAFRAANPPSTLKVDDQNWEYLVVGDGPQTILFLHGMTGAYDIWWQQIQAFKDEYRVVSVTYPAVDTLEEMEKGVLAVLDKAEVKQFNLVGTSLGGYFAQYLVAHHPERIQKVVFANTFPPNDLIKEKNGTLGSLVPYLPTWLVMNVLRSSISSSIYPASGNDELTLAFLNEISYGRMNKAQVAGRYSCVVEKFSAPDLSDGSIPVLIIQASNDPLVEATLRQQLLAAYPAAQVVTVDNGHFSYLGTPDVYNQTLRIFLR